MVCSTWPMSQLDEQPASLHWQRASDKSRTLCSACSSKADTVGCSNSAYNLIPGGETSTDLIKVIFFGAFRVEVCPVTRLCMRRLAALSPRWIITHPGFFFFFFYDRHKCVSVTKIWLHSDSPLIFFEWSELLPVTRVRAGHKCQSAVYPQLYRGLEDGGCHNLSRA